ncbi:hypothetical protein GCM10010420_46150 [Streptomyces glaucosporus]|uniref:Major facilitator superfamily (MFS) profile domain-containing protein n=1 Tax=Streptomyces glaucosporus TaxID=284044 RepID=A0ABP5VWC7_9ACTN
MSATSLGTLGTTRPGTAGPSPVRLRRLLALDAAVTAVNGLAYLALPGFLGRLLGVDAALLTGLGVFLLLYGAGVGVLASRPAPPRPGCAWWSRATCCGRWPVSPPWPRAC